MTATDLAAALIRLPWLPLTALAVLGSPAAAGSSPTCGSREAVASVLEHSGLRPRDPIQLHDEGDQWGRPTAFVQMYADPDDDERFAIGIGKLEADGTWHVCYRQSKP